MVQAPPMALLQVRLSLYVVWKQSEYNRSATVFDLLDDQIRIRLQTVGGVTEYYFLILVCILF